MTKAPRQTISIALGHNMASLSKEQKAFNTLIRQIEKRRDRLRSWESVVPVFHKKYVDELLPLQPVATHL